MTRRWPPYAVLALTCLLGWAFKGHCGTAWSDSIQYTTGCYSDAVPFWGLRGVAAGDVPYLQARMEYPVLTGALIWLEGGITRALGGDAAGFLAVASAFNAAFAFVVLWLMERAGVSRARLYAWAAAPVLVLYLGHNWDLLAVMLAMAGVLAAGRGTPMRGAALAALGTAAKLFPMLLLPLIGLDALLRRRWLLLVRMVAVPLLAWGVANLPVALLAPAGWREFYTFSAERAGTAASVWEMLSVHGWWASSIPARNVASLAAFMIGGAAIGVAGWRRHGERPWLLFTPLLAWFLLTNKVYSPQFDLWLYPFLVLSSRRLWPIAWFAVADVAAYFAEFWWFAGMDGAWPATTPMHIALAAAVRAAAMLWIIVAALRQPAPDWVATIGDNPAMPPSSADTPG